MYVRMPWELPTIGALTVGWSELQ